MKAQLKPEDKPLFLFTAILCLLSVPVIFNVCGSLANAIEANPKYVETHSPAHKVFVYLTGAEEWKEFFIFTDNP